MRIISGSAGGIPIKVPSLVTRPTTDRVREALFSMLGDAVESARVLDIFAGSGALGLECLSRGAREATFIEQHHAAVDIIRDNLKRSRLEGGQVLKGEALASLKRLADSGAQYEVIFADPPYAKQKGDTDWGAALLPSDDLRRVLAPGGVFVLECMMTKGASAAIPGWTTVRDRTYGSTRILLLQISPPDHGETSGAAPA